MGGLLFILLAQQAMFLSGPDKSKKSDLELIADFKRDSDRAALGILFKRYAHLVFGLCMKHLKNEAESQDAVINIFEKLMKDLKKHEVKHFKSWLYMVTKNHCLMFLRERKRAINKEMDIIREEQTRAVLTDEEEVAEKENRLTNVEEAVQSLKEDQRTCIELFYLKQKCYQEISDITGFTMKQVKSYIQNGKRNLRIILTRADGSQITR